MGVVRPDADVRDPKSLGGNSDCFGFGAASLYSFAGQHLTRGRLEEHASLVACRVEEDHA